MASRTKLEYKVIHASSNDDGHGAQQLMLRNDVERNEPDRMKNKGKGWQVARFCEYPQDLVIGLTHISDVTQIQILSHQAKIASKVEIWVGLDPDNAFHDKSTYKSINWRRLGYFMLGKNERSNWKARELKSVYINTTANYVKFSLHEPHINTINLFNQIGIVGLSILGNPTNSKQSASSSPPSLSLSDVSIPKSSDESKTDLEPLDLIDDSNNVLEQIRKLTILKKQAVEKEDYDEAKRYKLCIENLQNAQTMTKKKNMAVEMEDYDKAKELSLKIAALKKMFL